MKPFITVNFGAGTLKMAEFDVTEESQLRLLEYGVKPLGMEGSLESKREAALLKGVQELLAERNFLAKEANIIAPGFHVFSKFVKLPPVDTGKVTQIIQYEAQQNVPFPLEEVVWDYQITGTSGSGELEVLLVAVKADIVEALFRVCDQVGYRVQTVDVAPAALGNAFRFNYGDLDGCTLLLDIGAKTSNALLFEKGKFYARSINIGANTITQDFATESKLRFHEAEAIKIQEGFVSLGGAYAEPENKHQAAISKIARQVMTRLHIQVNQTIQFYRGQQGGSAPDRLFLSGGASIMPYTSEFFADKLKVEVEYFNPLRNLEIAPEVDLEHLATVAHSFGELVGSGLKNLAQCPVEVNLMPKSSRQKQEFSRKKPYLAAALCCFILVVGALGWFFHNAASQKIAAIAEVQTEVQPLENNDRKLKTLIRERDTALKEAQQLITYMDQQKTWVRVLGGLREAFLTTEKKFSREGINAGVWIESLSLGHPAKDAPISGMSAESQASPAATERMDRERARELAVQKMMNETYRLRSGGTEGGVETEMAGPGTTTAAGVDASANMDPTNQVATLRIECTAINLNPWTSDASRNTSLAYELLKEIRNNDLFDPQETRLVGNMPQVSNEDMTFQFELSVRLKRPIEL